VQLASWDSFSPKREGRDLASLIGELNCTDVALPTVGDLTARFREVVETAVESLGARSAALYLASDERLELAVQAGRPIPEQACVAEDCSLLQHVLSTATHLNVPDICSLPPGAPFAKSVGLACVAPGVPLPLLAVPVLSDGGAAIGVLEMLDFRDESGASALLPDRMVPLAASLAAQVGSLLTRARLVAQLREAQFDTIFRLSAAAEYRDPETATHIQRMSRYCALIARNLGLTPREVDLIWMASPMHDIGKLGIPDAILTKQGALTGAEWTIMRTHPRIGAEILAEPANELMEASQQVALTHHERLDGDGYPYGLKKSEIPLQGRIVTLGDAFDAITSPRRYKQAELLEMGLELTKVDAGKHFDPDCVDALEAGFYEACQIRADYASPDDVAA
jgi:putative two-component system response regulator